MSVTKSKYIFSIIPQNDMYTQVKKEVGRDLNWEACRNRTTDCTYVGKVG
jgi:hypothetical protein